MNTIDIVVVVLLILFALIGFVRGFTNSFLSFLASIFSFSCAFYLAKPISSFLSKTFGLIEKLASLVSTRIESLFQFTGSLTGTEIMENYCSAGNFLKKAMSALIDVNATYTQESIVKEISTGAGSLILMAICIILSFILIKIAFRLLAKLFDALKKRSIAFNGLDRVLGLILGACKALFVVGVVFVIAGLLQTVPAVANTLETVFENSTVAKPLYDFITNLVGNYINKIDFSALLAI